MRGFRWSDAGIGRMLVQRLLFSAAVLFGAVTVVFLIFALVPANVTAELVGLQADPEARAQLNENLGLDRPLGERYAMYVGRLARGDFGRSLAGLGEVRPLLIERVERTFPLVVAASGLALAAGLILALLLAWIDRPGLYRFADSVSLGFASVPVFVIALALTVAFGRGETVPVIYDGGWRSGILPVLALAIAPAFWVVRVVSSDLRRILRRDFILFRRSLGFSRMALILTAFGNVSLVSALGGNLALSLLLGTFFVEYAFNWPGLGQLLVYSLLRRDIPVVQGVVLCFAATIMLADLFAETARRLQERA